MTETQSKTTHELIEELRCRNQSGLILLIDGNGWERRIWGSTHMIYGHVQQLRLGIEEAFKEAEEYDTDE